MRKSIILGGSALLSALAIPAIALAAGAMGMGPDATMQRADVETMVKEHFAKADLNKDGAITREEIQTRRTQMHAERMDQRFKQMDSNNDGSVSRAEFDAAHQARMGDGPGMGPHHGMDGKPGGPGPMGGGMGPGPMGAGPMGPDSMMQGEPGYHMRGYHKMGHMGGRMFERADANKDGKVTLTEATTTALAHFDEVDTNKDKTVTPEERHAFHQKMRAAPKAN